MIINRLCTGLIYSKCGIIKSALDNEWEVENNEGI